MKKIICILMALALIMGFSACQNNTLNSQENSSQESSIPDEYIEFIKEFKDNLKDPSSMMLYGDVIVFHPEDYETISKTISFEYNAKNGFGGYVGKDFVEIIISSEDKPLFITSDSLEDFGLSIDKNSYTTTKKNYYGYLEESNTEMLEHYEVYDGEEVAKILGVEYYES